MKFVKRLSKVKTVVVKKLSSIKISSYKIYTKTKNRQEEKLKNFFKIIEAMFCFGNQFLKMILNESQLFGFYSFIKLHVSTVR